MAWSYVRSRWRLDASVLLVLRDPDSWQDGNEYGEVGLGVGGVMLGGGGRAVGQTNKQSTTEVD